jgi:hypothetical protein
MKLPGTVKFHGSANARVCCCCIRTQPFVNPSTVFSFLVPTTAAFKVSLSIIQHESTHRFLPNRRLHRYSCCSWSALSSVTDMTRVPYMAKATYHLSLWHNTPTQHTVHSGDKCFPPTHVSQLYMCQ